MLEPSEPGQTSSPKFTRRGKVIIGQSTLVLFESPLGGHFGRWTCTASDANNARLQTFERPFGAVLNLADFEYAAVRMRTASKLVDKLYLRFFTKQETGDRALAVLVPKADGAWREVRVALQTLEKKGAFDPSKVLSLDIHYQGPDAPVIDIAEILLAKKEK